MDLFYNGNFQEQFELLKKDIKEYAKTLGYNYKNRELILAYGEQSTVGNNILFVTPPLNRKKKPFKDRESIELIKTIRQYGLTNYIITPVFPIPLETISKKHIKDYRPWLMKTIYILEPRLIIVMGEDSELAFINRKYILRDYCGEKISTCHDADVILAYPTSYYLEHSEYEDPSYKNQLKAQEWTNIKTLYNKFIK